ncbi:MAG: hypothetical protein N2D54_10955, partial [Chloroflexota bacterium]
NNSFTPGPLSSDIGNLINLTFAYLPNAGFTGSIPSTIGDLDKLTSLVLYNNDFSGFIPTEIGNLTKLIAIYLDGNLLEGPIPPSMGNLVELNSFYLFNNDLTGSIPKELGKLTKAQQFRLNGNLLQGAIPSELGNLSNLTVLNLANNNLQGVIPTELGNLSQLNTLNLSNNEFSGNVPKELGKLTDLEDIILNDNAALTWAVPLEFTHLSKVILFNYSNTDLCGSNSDAYQAWETDVDNTGTLNTSGLFCDPIFADSFESGDISTWSGSVGESIGGEIESEALCKLCVNKAAAQVNSKGLMIRVNNKKAHFVKDTSPTADKRYHARFYIDINALSMNKHNNFKLFQGKMGTKAVFYILLRKYDGKYWLRGKLRNDAGNYQQTKWTILPKTSKAVEIDWQAATSDGADNGFLKIYINDVLKVKKMKVDNDLSSIKSVQLGVVQQIKPAYSISGKFYLDHFASDESAMIGK